MGWSTDNMAQGVLGFLQTCFSVIWKICLYWQNVSENKCDIRSDHLTQHSS